MRVPPALAVAVLAVAGVGSWPRFAAAQSDSTLQGTTETAVVQGIVLEEGTLKPVSGALVLWIRAGSDIERSVTDSLGAFRAELAIGDYVLEASSLGYAPTRTPPFSITEGVARGDPVFLEVLMTPAPIQMEGLDVSVERRVMRELQASGLSPEALGERWIGRNRIERMVRALDPRDVLRSARVAGMTISNNPHVLCVRFVRGNGCAATVLNGVEVTHGGAVDLDPGSIHAIAVLRPSEAVLRYGQKGRGGAVLIWTRDGRP